MYPLLITSLLGCGSCRPTEIADAAPIPSATTVKPPTRARASDARPASWAGIQAIAGGSLNPGMLIDSNGVIAVSGASVDPSQQSSSTSRAVASLCGAKAADAVRRVARRMVEREKQSGEGGAGVVCDLGFVETPDPAFGAIPGPAGVGTRGRPARYGVCTSAGVAEYDHTYSIYFAPRWEGRLVVIGLLDTEVGSALVDQDLSALANTLAQQIIRCP